MMSTNCCLLVPRNLLLSSLIFRYYRKGIGVSNRNNVGIRKRLAILSDETPELDKLQIDEQTFDEMESELTGPNQMSDFHRSNVQKLKKKAEYTMIQRKYFGNIKMPNFLTWSEKEQIKQLHLSEPSVWTFDKLSQSFPASPDIIKKIVKSNWKVENQERIVKHDNQVSKNWEKLKKGELEIDPVLKQHLMTFSSREQIQHCQDYSFVNDKIPSPVKGSEFSNIITGYQERVKFLEKSDKTTGLAEEKMLSTATENVSHSNKPQGVVSFVQLSEMRQSNDRSLTTLQELRNKVKEKHKVSSNEKTEMDEDFLKGGKRETSKLVQTDIETTSVKSLVSESTLRNVDESKLTQTSDEFIPMKIKIPENAPKGLVYRKKDVYYDMYGRFLYRVPGMKGYEDN